MCHDYSNQVRPKIASTSNKSQQKEIKHHYEDQAFLHHKKKLLRKIRCTSFLKSRLRTLYIAAAYKL